jgi:hypothetical protein
MVYEPETPPTEMKLEEIEAEIDALHEQIVLASFDGDERSRMHHRLIQLQRELAERVRLHPWGK